MRISLGSLSVTIENKVKFSKNINNKIVEIKQREVQQNLGSEQTFTLYVSATSVIPCVVRQNSP